MKKERISKRELRARIKRNPKSIKAYLAAHPGAIAHFDNYLKKKIKEFLSVDETDDEQAAIALDQTLETSIDQSGDDNPEQDDPAAATNAQAVDPA